MSAPRRRPIELDDLDLAENLKRAAAVATEIELGWSIIRQEMRDAGWPQRSENGKRSGVTIRNRCRTCDELLEGAAGKDEHRTLTGHNHYELVIIDEQIDPSSIDYADPTGELSTRFDAILDDLDAMQVHHLRVLTSLRALRRIAVKWIPDTALGEPACAIPSCDQVVERTGNGYRGVVRVAGHWCARPGTRPVCAMHRKRDERS